MKNLVAALCMVVVVGFATAQDKKEAKKFDSAKLVGTWEVTKGMPKGAIIEMTKDGKMTFTADLGGKELKLEGSYKLDGEKLALTIKTPDGMEIAESLTIKELTDDKLVTLDKDGKEDELTKKKAKK